jgi:hypothetical protein
MVPAGSILTYNCTFSNANYSGWQSIDPPSPSDVETAVAAEAAQNNLSVVSAQLGADWYVYYVNQFSIQVRLNGDFNSSDDVQAILDHAVYDATGSLPIASSVSSIQTPAGAVTSTGQPNAVTGTTQTSVGGTLSTVATNITGGANSLSSLLNPSTWGTSTTIIIGLLAIAALIILAFTFAPTGTSRAIRAARA